MGTLIESYTELLLRLMPRGRAWAQGGDSRLRQLLSGLAAELAHVDERAQELLAESYPGTTFELLVDWERVTGLPDPCVGELRELAQRRAAVLARLGTLAEQRPDFYVWVASTLGFQVSVREYHTAYCGTAVCSDPIGAGYAYAWEIVVDGTYEPPSERLECALRRLAPAHTVLLFSYEPLCLPFTDELGNPGHIHQHGGGIQILSDETLASAAALLVLSEDGILGRLELGGPLEIVDETGGVGELTPLEGALPFIAETGSAASIVLEVATVPGLVVGSLNTSDGRVALTLENGQERSLPLVACPEPVLRDLIVTSEDGVDGVLRLDTGGVPFSTELGAGGRIVNQGATIPFIEEDGTESVITLGPLGLEAALLNVIVFVADDLGFEALRIYQSMNAWPPGFDYPATPHLDALAADGVIFDGFYAAPVCSPFRASLLSGKRIAEHRLGFAVNKGASHTLGSIPGVKLPALLAEYGVRSGAVMKWHLGRGEDEPLSPRTDAGFGVYQGKVENAGIGSQVGGQNQTWERYTYWRIDEDGNLTAEEHINDVHLQVRAYNDARASLTALRASGDPWFLYVPFYFPHGTYAPTQGSWLAPSLIDPVSGGPYHTRGAWEDIVGLEAIDVLRQMVESMDTMIGGILAQLSEEELARTVVCFVCDNGTDNPILASPSLEAQHSGEYPAGRAKRSAYELGVRVPMFIWGGAQTGIVGGGRVVRTLAEANDLYATIAEAFGAEVDPELYESRSLWPILRGETTQVREYATTQRHTPLGAQPRDYAAYQVCVVNAAGWKFIETSDGEGVSQELYDLNADRWELDDRYAAALAPGPIRNQLLDLRGELNRVWDRANLAPALVCAADNGIEHLIHLREDGLPITAELGAEGFVVSDGTSIEFADEAGALGELLLITPELPIEI